MSLQSLQSIPISDYDYPLPDEQIAQYPLAERHNSRLLIVKNGLIAEDSFSNLPEHLPADSLLISNQTKVVHARLLFQKASGSIIEIFCLEPLKPVTDIQLAFQQTDCATWKCLVGNARRWKSGVLELETLIDNKIVVLKAEQIEKSEGTFTIEFRWSPGHFTFARVLEHFGKIPLPPYISRELKESDSETYQTVFARNEGSVAAPTAGLHFTPVVLEKLAARNISTDSITLHVGAGTFKPVSSVTIGEHQMHQEQVIVSIDLLKKICSAEYKHITLVGTTTVRTMESIYWQGVKWLIQKPEIPALHINQWDPYQYDSEIPVPVNDSFKCVINVLEQAGLTELHGATSLMIAPGYKYIVPDAIITNFHQPRSTLLLLVSAFIGNNWKLAYEYALKNNFRFLSYGDSCLFFKH